MMASAHTLKVFKVLMSIFMHVVFHAATNTFPRVRCRPTLKEYDLKLI